MLALLGKANIRYFNSFVYTTKMNITVLLLLSIFNPLESERFIIIIIIIYSTQQQIKHFRKNE